MLIMLYFVGVKLLAYAIAVLINAVHIVVCVHHGDKLIIIIAVHQLRFIYSDALRYCEPPLKPVFAFDRAGAAFVVMLRTAVEKSDISLTSQNACMISVSSESESGF